ncbi:MAG: hypothetical protein EAZ29_01500, partial [Runella slithyformis]
MPFVTRMSGAIYLVSALVLDAVFLWYAVQWVGWLLSLVWLVFGRFLCKHYIMDYILRQSFYVFIGYFFLIMFGVPLFVLVLTNLALGIWWFKTGYYSSEYIMPQVFFGKSEQKP